MPSSPTWPEVPHNACVVVPVGSFEQHGPHLPLDTDTQIATHLCVQATTNMENVVVAPPLIGNSKWRTRRVPWNDVHRDRSALPQ